MNVLSLFDGMSCGQVALQKAGIKVDNYYASEIDKYAQIISKKNFPETIYLGDVREINGGGLPRIDLLIGGSPCQSFSFAGKRKGMSTKDAVEILTLEHYLKLKSEGFEFEGQSYLFWEYMRLLKETNPKYFLLENVVMGKKWQRILTQAIGINPIQINSALLSAQNRERLYWTNINSIKHGFFQDNRCAITQPNDKKIFLRDILQKEVDDKYFLSDKALESINKHDEKQKANGNGFAAIIRNKDEKAQALPTGSFKSTSTFIDSNPDIVVHNMMPRNSKSGKGGTGHLTRSDGKTYCLDTGSTNAVEFLNERQKANHKTEDEKPNTFLSTAYKGSQANGMTLVGTSRIRRLTPIESERLQTIPDDYTNGVSDTQRYKMIGNGWTADVIAHIFSYIKNDITI